MQHTYGIYEDEIEPVLVRIRSGAPLADIEATPCPCCNSTIGVWFSPEGDYFGVSCAGKPPHFSIVQDIAVPPDWWRERVGDFSPVTFYWAGHHHLREDGTLLMKTSGYSEKEHWSGGMEVRAGDADYALWKWILAREPRVNSLITDKDLERLREEFRHEVRH